MWVVNTKDGLMTIMESLGLVMAEVSHDRRGQVELHYSMGGLQSSLTIKGSTLVSLLASP